MYNTVGKICARARRTKLVYVLALVCAGAVVACGSEGGGAPMGAYDTTTTYATTNVADSDWGYDSNVLGAARDSANQAQYDQESGGGLAQAQSFEQDPAGNEPADTASAPGGEQVGAAPAAPRPKVIRNGSISLQAKDVEATVGSIENLAYEVGGYVFGKNYQATDENVTAKLTLKIPPERLDEFEARLRGAVGEQSIRSIDLASTDITSSYYDIASRLESMKLSLRQYQEIFEKANTIRDVLEVQREIAVLQAEIDSCEGQIRMWDSLVAFATLEVYVAPIREEPPLSSQDEAWRFNTASEIGGAMRNGFVASTNMVFRIFVSLAIFLSRVLPFLIPIAGVVGIAAVIARRGRKKREAASQPKQPSPQQPQQPLLQQSQQLQPQQQNAYPPEEPPPAYLSEEPQPQPQPPQQHQNANPPDGDPDSGGPD